MQKINYQKQLDKIIENLGDKVPSLLLHSCCAPCSSYCIEYLSQHFNITVLYYNPNIYPEAEYEKRKDEQKRLISEMETKHSVKMLDCDFESENFYEMARGLEGCRECGERCFKCYHLRLQKTAVEAKNNGFDYFTTTLTISPLKNAEKINEIGNELADEYGIHWLPSDFKKKEGYKRSIELSKVHNLYRQNYCGCVFSQNEQKKTDIV